MSNKNYVSKRFTAMLLMVVTILAMIPFPSVAATRWSLEGWRDSQETWTSGNLFTWYEGDSVPYRLSAQSFDLDSTTPPAITIGVDHDHIDAKGNYGVDYAEDWFIGPIVDKGVPLSSIPINQRVGLDPNFFAVSASKVVPTSNGSRIEYQINLQFNDDLMAAFELADLSTQNWAIYWTAHLSVTKPGISGSSNWNGASLHTHTSVTGSMDVPISTPPKESSLPSINIEKFTNGEDADTATGPKVLVGNPINWRFEVKNTGPFALKDVIVTDTVPSGSALVTPQYVSGDEDPRDYILAPGETWIYEASGTATLGQYSNTAKVTAEIVNVKGKKPASTTAMDEDMSHYIGINPPMIDVTKTANPTSISETGGDVTFTITVKNVGEETVELTSVEDSVFGTINLDDFDVKSLSSGEIATYSFTEFMKNEPSTPHQNTVTVIAKNADGLEATDSDDASVAFTDVTPSILVTKTADPTSVPETGGYVTFTVTVENNGTETVDLFSSNDDVYGNININLFDKTTLAVDDIASYSFTEWVSGDVSELHKNTVTVTAKDNDGTSVTKSDYAEVTFTDVIPSIIVTKTADPILVPETGADVTFTINVKNTSKESVTLTEASDSVFTEYDVSDFDKTQLYPNEIATLSFTKWVTGDSEKPHVNLFTVKAKDNEDNQAQDDDDATVTFVDVITMIQVIKTANPTSVPETGGEVTFTVEVQNIGTEPVTLTKAIDTEFGTFDIDEFDDLTLEVGQKTNLSFSRFVNGEPTTQHENFFTVTAEDGSETEVSDSDNAIVIFTDILPSVEVTKTAEPTFVPETGSDVDYTVTIKNTSTEYLEIDSVNDTMVSGIASELYPTLPNGLNPGETYTGTYTVYVDGKYPGSKDNTFTATLKDNDGNSDTDSANATVTFTANGPAISITKTTSSSSIRAGNTVTWTYVVTNTGNVDLLNIEVTDDNGTPLNDSDDFPVTTVDRGEDPENEILSPGENWTYTATGIAIRGLYKNIAYVTARASGEKEVSAQDDSSYTGFVPSNPRPDPDPDPGRIEIFKFLDFDESKSFNDGDLPFSNILFQLFDEGDDLVGTATTNSQGNAVFSNLDEGTYFIKEVRGDYTITTPTLNADGMIEVKVVEDETTEVSIGNYREVIPPQEPPLGPPPVIEEVIEDKVPQGPPLPKTGELPPYFAYGFGSLLVLAGLFMKRKF